MTIIIGFTFSLAGRKIKATSELICPLCQLTLRPGEVESHFAYEWQKLSKSRLFRTPVQPRPPRSRQGSFDEPHASLSSDLHQGESSVSLQSSSASSGGHGTGHSSDTLYTDPSPSQSVSSSVLSKEQTKKVGQGFQSYKRVKINRLLRLQSKRWQAKDMGEGAICPVCGENVPASTAADLQIHAEMCLRKQEEGEDSSDDETVEVEGDEYEWCGMRKVRLTSLLKSQGQLDALGTLVEKGDEEANVEVCLLQEEEDKLGPSQYSQEDLNPPSTYLNSGNEEDSELLARGHLPVPHILHSSDLEAPEEGKCEAEGSAGSSAGPLVEALQVKIRELEERGVLICHICHGLYDVPLTSIVCWHVHCEKCWLQTLSSQKLCPQCKVIVSPTELRRIYL